MISAAKVLSTFFGLGFIPPAPGTLASLTAALLYKFFLHSLAWPVYAALILVLFVVGVRAATVHARALGQKDPGTIVIDEVCGQLTVLFLVPAAWLNVLVGFLMFRAFDVLKPFPIRKLEGLPRGWGIMADDMAAAIYGAGLIQIFLLVRGV
jgi:phosphatidylglycerophosphatase A